MTESCDEWSRDLAALAIGALGPQERVAVVAHVDGCPACAQALADLRATVAVLDRADPDHLRQPVPAPSGLDSRVLEAVAQEKARSRRRALVRWGAAAAAMAVIVGTGALIASRTSAPAPVGEVVALAAPSDPGVPSGELELPDVTATVTPKAWGTAMDLRVDGSTPGVVYRVWVADATGQRTSAGTFMGADRTLTVATAAGLARGEATVIGVSTDEGDPLVVAELSAPATG